MRAPSLLIIFLSVFIDLIGFGIVMPLLPVYSKEFGASGFMVGAIIASFSLMQFLFAPAWGRLSDRIGRRPVILISNAGAAVSYALFAIASGMEGQQALWLLLASRIFAGICGANLSVASAYIADVSPPEKRTSKMGLIGMAFGFGFIFGPALGGLSYDKIGPQGPGWVAAAICATNFLLGCFILAESRKPGSDEAPQRPGLDQWAHTMRHPIIGIVVIVYFLATFCFAAFESTFSLLAKLRYNLDPEHVSYLFTYTGVIAALVQGGLVGRLNKRMGEKKLIVISLVFVGLSLGLMPYVSKLPGILFAVGMFAAFSGINRPPTFGLISLNTSAAEQGAALGIAQSAGSLARILGPIFGNVIFARTPALPYLICAGIAVGAAIYAGLGLLGKGKQTTGAAANPA
jgi:MFS transporter, DHA1 family, tetracycline resistance protein